MKSNNKNGIKNKENNNNKKKKTKARYAKLRKL